MDGRDPMDATDILYGFLCPEGSLLLEPGLPVQPELLTSVQSTDRNL